MYLFLLLFKIINSRLVQYNFDTMDCIKNNLVAFSSATSDNASQLSNVSMKKKKKKKTENFFFNEEFFFDEEIFFD